MELFETMKILNINNQTNLENKLLNSMLKIKFLEKNNNISNLLFNNFSIFKNPDDYRHIISLSYSKFLFKFNNIKENGQFRKIMSDILLKFTFLEMTNCLNDLKKKLFSHYESYNYFLDLLLENYLKLKPLEYFINEKIFEIIKKIMDIKIHNKQKLLENQKFIDIISKSFIILLNSEGKYNPKNYFQIFDMTKQFLNYMNNNDFLIKIFKIFFIELYVVSKLKKEKYEINLKYQFLNNCNDIDNFSKLELQKLDINLFNYLGNVIKLFTSFSPDIQIINCIKNYFNNSFYLFYQVYLIEYNNLLNNSYNKSEKYFFLCNFFHLFQSQKIGCSFFYYLIEYHKKKNNLNFFELFQDFYACLINTFNLCPHPFYFDIIIDIFKDSNNYEQNKIYLYDIIEMISKIEFCGENNFYKYINYFYNIILIIKFFYIFSKTTNIINDYKLCTLILEIIKKIKNYFFIFSHYLIKLDSNDNLNKTLLELCSIIVINITFASKESNEWNNNFYELFLDENIKDDKDNKFGKSIMFIFDTNNNLLNYKYKKEITIENYINNDFENYLQKKENKKEEKSIIIKLIFYMNELKNKNYVNNNFIDKFFDLLIDDLIIIINNSTGFKKTKTDNFYNSIIDSINNTKKISKIITKENIFNILAEITSKDKTHKLSNFFDDCNDFKFLEKDENYIDTCLLKDNCLLLKKHFCETFEDLDNNSFILYSYFDIDITDVVKCLKKDLLLKECSIYFNDIYTKDHNFIKIKHSYFYNYKDNLENKDNEELFNYPTKLKNYSSCKYFTPKIFLSCYTSLYNNKFFSYLYPKITNTLIKNKSFPSLPNHYIYYQNLLINNNDDNLILISFDCELISIRHIIFGKIDLYDKFILFKNKDKLDDYDTSLEFIYSSGIKDISTNKKIIIINYNEIEEIITRTFAYNTQAMEIFLKNGKSYLFNLFHEKNLKKFYENIEDKINDENICIIKDTKNTFEKKGLTKKWQMSQIDNYQYLLYLNKYSGRTYNDINQYPIFPWIILTSIYNKVTKNINETHKDESNKNENENESEINNSKICFRDMKYFLMTQTEEGIENAKFNYKELENESPKKGYHFSLHYSACGFVLLYLMRLSPFTEAHIKFQSGKFDNPNRLINSIEELLETLIDFKDNRELIPEFFTNAEYFYNLNYIFFGIKASNILINNIHTSLFGSLKNYIYYNRLFLNNRIKEKNINFPKCKIYNWINLIFGNKQYPASLNALNKFEKYCYRQNVSLIKYYDKYKNKKKLKDEEIIKLIKNKKSRILNFGQCPEKLFNSKHYNYKIDLTNQLNKGFELNIEFMNKNLNIITFWLSENGTYIYLLTKNKENNLSILIFDEKYNKKCEIIIDKIKLFNCKNNIIKKENNDEINKNDFNLIEKKKQLKKIDLQEDINKKYYFLNDLSELYMLNPRNSIIDLSLYDNIYFVIGRYKDNSIRIYEEHNKNGKCVGLIKTNSFVSVIFKKDKETFFTGHKNGKLIEWNITYKEIIKQNHKLIHLKTKKSKIIENIKFKREIIAHNYSMITSINYSEKHNIILTSDLNGFLYIRKYYDFEFLTKIKINNFCFINNILITDYDMICTINYNILEYKNYISFYTLNGILLEKSNLYHCIDTCLLKNGKIIFNCLNENYLLIFGFNGNTSEDKNIGNVVKDYILKNLDIKKDIDNIKNFIIDNNNIYLILKNGKFIKAYYNKLDSLSYGINKFD